MRVARRGLAAAPYGNRGDSQSAGDSRRPGRRSDRSRPPRSGGEAFHLAAEEAARLSDAAEKAGIIALVGHEFRFAPARVTFRQALADGAVGPPRLATFVGHIPLVAPLDMATPPWWFDRDRGGGWLGASVSHLVDAIRTWLGEFDTVSASLPVVSDRDPLTHAEDTAAARFRMRSGCEGILQQSAAVWGDRVETIRVAGPHGTLTLESDSVELADSAGTRTLERFGPPLPVEMEPSDDPRHQFTHIELGPAIVQAGVLRDLALGRPPAYDTMAPATFADGLACMQVLDAIRSSAAKGGAWLLCRAPDPGRARFLAPCWISNL